MGFSYMGYNPRLKQGIAMSHSTNPPSNLLPLGQNVSYPEHYDASVLCAIPRAQGREPLALQELPFQGEDIWTAYELSWLNAKGKPQVALGELRVPCESANMVESKSLKLYFNSFNQTRFDDWHAVQQRVQQDLANTTGVSVQFKLCSVQDCESQILAAMPGQCIDELDIEVADYAPNADGLVVSDSELVEETVHSHLLKSNCRITSQPDWASVMIRYKGAKIDQESLLRYIIGFRQHDEFHEPCVEKMFTEILRKCKPEQLTVYARYTRRGGLDINPFRSNFEQAPENLRLPRQ